MSRDFPSIFSGPMVRALFEGRKTQTRRIVKLPTKGEYVRPDMGGWAATTVGGGKSFVVRRGGAREPAPEFVAIWNQTTGTCLAARYQAGDRLWVREAFATDGPVVRYVATDHIHELRKKKPSIHMPRWASRLSLIVTSVKIERLQDISDPDIMAEGVVAFTSGPTPMFGIHVEGGYEHAGLTPRETFINLWCTLHGPAAWNDNPFVVVPTFRVIKANIDAPEARIAA